MGLSRPRPVAPCLAPLVLFSLLLAGCGTQTIQNRLPVSAQTPSPSQTTSNATASDPATGRSTSPAGTGSVTSPTSAVSTPSSGALSTTGSNAFAGGINVAWVHFAADIGTGNPDLTTLGNQFAQVAGAGGKVARLWLHTDGTTTPTFSGTEVSGLDATAISDLQQILDLAQAQGIQVMLTLWSFDMLRATLKQTNPDIVTRNRLLLTDSPSLQLYLDQALTPLVNAVKNHPALYAWDVINEPEGMTAAAGWSLIDAQDDVTTANIQTFINRISGRIHQLAPANRVTSGAVSFNYLSKTVGVGNNYADSALVLAGGDTLGTLDFYQVHYYDSVGTQFSPFLHPASYFGTDKPVMVGEFYLQEYLTAAVAAPHLLYAKLQSLGYMGALGWKDTATPALNLMLNAMVYLQYPADLGTDPDLCSNYGGGYGAPFFDGTTLYRMQTAQAAATPATSPTTSTGAVSAPSSTTGSAAATASRCIVE